MKGVFLMRRTRKLWGAKLRLYPSNSQQKRSFSPPNRSAAGGSTAELRSASDRRSRKIAKRFLWSRPLIRCKICRTTLYIRFTSSAKVKVTTILLLNGGDDVNANVLHTLYSFHCGSVHLVLPFQVWHELCRILQGLP